MAMPADSETRCPSDTETVRPSDSETSRPSDSETPRPSDSETCLSPWIRKLQRRIRKLPGPRIRKLAYPPGFGNFNVGFGNFHVLGFGNLPIPMDSETSTSDSETSRRSDSETCLSPRIRKLQRRIRKLPGLRIRKLAYPPGFGNFNVGFGHSQALGFGNLPSLGFGNFNVRFGNFQALGFGNFVTDKVYHR